MLNRMYLASTIHNRDAAKCRTAKVSHLIGLIFVISGPIVMDEIVEKLLRPLHKRGLVNWLNGKGPLAHIARPARMREWWYLLESIPQFVRKDRTHPIAMVRAILSHAFFRNSSESQLYVNKDGTRNYIGMYALLAKMRGGSAMLCAAYEKYAVLELEPGNLSGVDFACWFCADVLPFVLRFGTLHDVTHVFAMLNKGCRQSCDQTWCRATLAIAALHARSPGVLGFAATQHPLKDISMNEWRDFALRDGQIKLLLPLSDLYPNTVFLRSVYERIEEEIVSFENTAEDGCLRRFDLHNASGSTVAMAIKIAFICDKVRNTGRDALFLSRLMPKNLDAMFVKHNLNMKSILDEIDETLKTVKIKD
jgi:hypothetical protein